MWFLLLLYEAMHVFICATKFMPMGSLCKSLIIKYQDVLMINMSVTSEKPLVTVAIPVYNAAAFLVETVQSVINQDYNNLEILLVDNCSTDKSWDIIRSFSDPRIKAVQNDENIGAEGNFNKCLELASGVYFLLLPSDDLLFEGAIRRRVAVLEEDLYHNLAFCFCARNVINASSKKITTVSFFETGFVNRIVLLRKNVVKGTNVVGEPAAGLFRTGLGRKVGDYNQELPYVIDLDYWVRLLEYGDAYYIDEPLCAFRVTTTNWSSQLADQRYKNFKAIIDKIAALDYSEITKSQRYHGLFRARINEYLRRIFYFLLPYI